MIRNSYTSIQKIYYTDFIQLSKSKQARQRNAEKCTSQYLVFVKLKFLTKIFNLVLQYFLLVVQSDGQVFSLKLTLTFLINMVLARKMLFVLFLSMLLCFSIYVNNLYSYSMAQPNL